MNFELIRDWPDFYVMENEWNDLLISSESNTLFLTWEWITSWIDTLGKINLLPLIILIRGENGKLIGAAPFYFMHYRLFKIFKFKCLRVMGEDRVSGEYPDAIVNKEFQQEVMMLFSKILNDIKKEWDFLWIPKTNYQKGERCPLLKEIQNEKWNMQDRPTLFSSFSLPQSMDQYLGRFSSKTRNTLSRYKKKILKNDFKFYKITQQKNLDDNLEMFFELHHKRWEKEKQVGSFMKRRYLKTFYKSFVPKALDNGWLRFYKLEVDGQCRAMQIGYVYNDIFHQMQEAFDPLFTDGVGNVLRLLVIEDLIGEKVKTYDFLGGFTKHKERWKAQKRIGQDLLIVNDKVKNKILFTKKIWPSGRLLKPVINF
jgi:CelD/BcsL family acetyltransferase involved in cellulose biosynthesis